MPSNILLFGAPGSGKGTMAESLKKDFGYLHVSAGDLLRAEVMKKSTLGKQVARIMEDGHLIPDDLIIKVMLDRLSQPDAKARGVLLDGFPRTLRQAEELTASGVVFTVMIFLNVDSQTLVDRCVLRRLDPETGRIYNLKTDPPPKEVENRLLVRSDDTREKHSKRMKAYRMQKNDLMNHYRDIVLELDGNPPMQQVYASLKAGMELLEKGGSLDDVRRATQVVQSKL